MIGAITGDVIGSVYEGAPAREKEFPLFHQYATYTDDTVLTVAVASAIMEAGDYAAALKLWGRRYPDAGYGPWFNKWLSRDDAPPALNPDSWTTGTPLVLVFEGQALFDDLLPAGPVLSRQ